MAKPEWGTKRICPSCGAKFYDFNRDPLTCPACQTVLEPGAHAEPRRARAAPKLAAAALADADVPAKVIVDDEVEDEIEEADDEIEVDEEVEADADIEADEDVEVDEDETVVADEDEEDEDDGENAIEDVSELGDDDMADVIDTDLDEDETER